MKPHSLLQRGKRSKTKLSFQIFPSHAKQSIHRRYRISYNKNKRINADRQATYYRSTGTDSKKHNDNKKISYQKKKKTQLWMIFKGQRVFKHQLKEKGSLTPLTGSHLPPTGWDTTYGTHSLAHLSRKPKTLNDLAKIRTSILLCHCLYQCNTFNGFPALQCEKNPNKCSETTKLKHF